MALQTDLIGSKSVHPVIELTPEEEFDFSKDENGKLSYSWTRVVLSSLPIFGFFQGFKNLEIDRAFSNPKLTKTRNQAWYTTNTLTALLLLVGGIALCVLARENSKGFDIGMGVTLSAVSIIPLYFSVCAGKALIVDP